MSERGSWVLQAAAGGLVAFNSVCALEAATSVTIRHDPPACVLADAFPRLVAWVEPPGKAARVRLAFRPEAAQTWHAVGTELTDSGFVAVLPRPRLAAQRIHYRFEATAPSAEVVTSPAYSAEVVADAAACGGRVAETVPSANVMVEVPPGAPLVPPVPPGFDPVGAVSTPRKGSSKKKVGLLAGAIIGGGAVAAGVAAGGGAASPSSTVLQPAFVRIQSSTPPFFSEVSVAANNMTVEVAVSPPRTLEPGEAWIILYNPSTHPAEQPCAVLGGPHPRLEAGREGRFVVRTPFLHAIPCGTSTSVRIVFRTTSGQQILQSGDANWLDGSAVYNWIP